jgi:uncharacterized protein
MNKQIPQKYSNPYLAGVGLGLVLLTSFVILGAGLGASSGIARIGAQIEGMVAPEHTLKSEYFGAWGKQPTYYYLVFMLAGVFAGGLFSSMLAGRGRVCIERGNSAGRWLRISLALMGGVLAGFASRLANGCTSGQALTGSALMMTGSMVFLVCIFIGGYAAASFVRRQWND